MFWILLLLLTVFGGGAALALGVHHVRKQLGAGDGAQKQLAAAGDRLLERTVRDLRVDDVLTMDGRDFLVEGLIAYDEDGHRWTGARIVDGSDVQWLVVGLDRASASSIRVLARDDSAPITGYPPEAQVIGEVRYALDKRGAATCQLFGDLGGLGGMQKDRPEGHVERCRWWLYSAPGDDTVLVEQWGSDYRTLRGKKVGDGVVELIPGS